MSEEATPEQQAKNTRSIAGMFLAVGTVLCCSFNMVPGWGMDWNAQWCLIAVAITGAIGGCFFSVAEMSPEVSLPIRVLIGLIAGPIASVGALIALMQLLDRMDVIPKIVYAITLLVGAVPGMLIGRGLGFVATKVFDRTPPSSPTSTTTLPPTTEAE